MVILIILYNNHDEIVDLLGGRNLQLDNETGLLLFLMVGVVFIPLIALLRLIFHYLDKIWDLITK